MGLKYIKINIWSIGKVQLANGLGSRNNNGAKSETE